MSRKKAGKLVKNPLLRGLSVYAAGAKTGGAMVADKALNRWLPQRNSNALLAKEAKNFARQLGEHKGTYAKAGQMLALMGKHFLPVELTDALHTLESDTAPIDWEFLEPSVREQLGDRYDGLDICPEPLATASLAQVHRATIIATGDEICLKILYPGIAETIEADFDAVINMLKFARWIKASRELDDWLQKMREQIYTEVDYAREADMTEHMADLLQDDERYAVPKLYRPFCAAHILALEYMPGVAVTSDLVAALPQPRRDALAKNMLGLFFHEVFDWSLMQTDPNFGNFKIAIGEDSDRIVLLDFGSVLTCESKFTAALGNTILAAQRQDNAAVVAGLMALGCLRTDSTPSAQTSFANFCLHIMEPLREVDDLPPALLNARGQYRWAESELLKRAGKKAAKSSLTRDFDLPSQEFAFIARKLTGVFTFIAVLKAEFNGAPLLQEHL